MVGGELTITCRTSAEVCSNVRLVRGGDRVDESVLMGGIPLTSQTEGKRIDRWRFRVPLLHQLAPAGFAATFVPTGRGILLMRAAGTYTLIVSNHRAGEEGDFTLVLHCALPMQLGAIKQEGAGLFGRSATGRFDDAERACFVVDVPKSAGVK